MPTAPREDDLGISMQIATALNSYPLDVMTEFFVNAITLKDAAYAVLGRTRKVFSLCRADVAQVRPAASRQSSPWHPWWKMGGQRDTLVASTRDTEYPGRKFETGGLL